MTFYDYDLGALRWINHYRCKLLDPFFVLITKTAIPLSVVIGFVIIILGLIHKNRVLRFKGWLVILGILINELIVNFLKYSIHRIRPYVNHPDIDKLTEGGSPSFPSGHTANAFAVALIVSLLFKCPKPILITLWLWTFFVAYSRMLLGVHYPSDVLGAVVIGSFTTLLLYRTYLRPHYTKLVGKYISFYKK